VKTVDFYFDYLSPFAYLASLEIEAICAAHQAAVTCRPVLFPALLDHWGQRGPAEIPPKAVHALKDCARYARSRSIAFRSPKFHPFNPLLALRSTCAASGDAEAFRIMHALYALGWARGGDLADPSEIHDALTGAGIDARPIMERAQSPEIKTKLREQTAAAVARGVFGIPTMFAGDELFWGRDQLSNLGSYLAGRDPLDGIDWTQFGPQGVGAWRSGVTGRDDAAKQ
jgi:2-hydroxychromene-2-carboxylate isomerase